MSDHPDLEALSASLDGEDEGAAVHAAACPACQAQLAQLQSVRETVGRPVSPPSDAMDLAIARAVAAADEWAPVEAPAEPVPTPPPAPASWPPPGRERRVPTTARPVPARRWRLWVTGSAAAAVVAVVVLTALLVSGGSGTREDDTALSAGPTPTGVREAAPPGAATGAAGAGAPSAAGTVGGYDLTVQELGDVTNVGALRDRVGAARATSSSPALAPTADAASPVPRVVGTRVCEAEARTGRPSLGVVVYVANLRFQGTPAVALGFAPAPGTMPVSLLVLAPGEGCRLLAETTIP